jgi:predicted phosphodiesterase
MNRSLYFCGDPHGDFQPLLDLLYVAPGTVVIVGDLELGQPIKVTLAPLFDAGWDVRWVLGNHDSDTCEALLHLISAKGGHPDGDLNAKVTDLEGVAVAGLGGTFKGKIWNPKVGAPKFPSRQSWMDANRQRWLGGLPIHLRDAIWHEDVQKLESQRADILVCHEGPTSVWMEMGVPALDDLGEAMGAKWLVHGHHHHSGVDQLPNGILVKALGIGEIWRFPE